MPAETVNGGSSAEKTPQPADTHQASESQIHDREVRHGFNVLPPLSPTEVQDFDDNDSAIGGLGSYTTSIYTTASLDEVVQENGRTYHIYKDGKYMLPNDEVELNRLDMQHKMWNITLDGKLHLAPIGPTPRNVLDIATGSGIWAVEFADAYQSAAVTGTDLSAIQPSYVPPNCEFIIDDAEDEWVFPSKFDYIHVRAVATCFREPARIIQQAYDALLPDGWLELQDVCLQRSDDGTLENGPTALYEWQAYVNQATIDSGRVWTNVPNYKRWMIEAGFEDVTEVNLRWPSNQWSCDKKEQLLGAWMQAQIEHGLVETASARLFMTKLAWSKERFDAFMNAVKKDTKDPNIHAYNPITIVYGRKPKVAEVSE